MSNEDEGTDIPRAMLEALASSAMTEGLDMEQQTYEKWLDDVEYQGPWPQIPWDNLSSETQAEWRKAIHDTSIKSSTSDPKRGTGNLARKTPKIRATGTKKEWTPSSKGDPDVKNRPKCPLCTSLKKSTPCMGGPPCMECKRKGYTASECLNYVPGQGNKGRKRRMVDDSERPPKRPRVRSKHQNRDFDLEMPRQVQNVVVVAQETREGGMEEKEEGSEIFNDKTKAQ